MQQYERGKCKSSAFSCDSSFLEAKLSLSIKNLEVRRCEEILCCAEHFVTLQEASIHWYHLFTQIYIYALKSTLVITLQILQKIAAPAGTCSHQVQISTRRKKSKIFIITILRNMSVMFLCLLIALNSQQVNTVFLWMK